MLSVGPTHQWEGKILFFLTSTPPYVLSKKTPPDAAHPSPLPLPTPTTPPAAAGAPPGELRLGLRAPAGPRRRRHAGPAPAAPPPAPPQLLTDSSRGGRCGARRAATGDDGWTRAIGAIEVITSSWRWTASAIASGLKNEGTYVHHGVQCSDLRRRRKRNSMDLAAIDPTGARSLI
jgi:hypothetical protein